MTKDTHTFDRENSLGWLTAVLHQRMAAELDKRLAEQGLSIGLWPTLMCLWEEDNVTQVEIARKVLVQNSTTTRVIDKLETLGLVTRQPDQNSRRSYRIQLTEKGHRLKDTVLPMPAIVNQQTLTPLSDEQQQQLVQLLRKLVLDV